MTELPTKEALAFLGDAIFSHYVRLHLVQKGTSKAKELNELALEYVTAQKQYEAFKILEPLLTEEEHDIFKRAYNSNHLNKPKTATIVEYRTATGLEALLGFLEIEKRKERIEELMSVIFTKIGN